MLDSDFRYFGTRQKKYKVFNAMENLWKCLYIQTMTRILEVLRPKAFINLCYCLTSIVFSVNTMPAVPPRSKMVAATSRGSTVMLVVNMQSSLLLIV